MRICQVHYFLHCLSKLDCPWQGQSRYTHPLAKWCIPTVFADTTVCIKLADTKRLIAELQLAVDIIETGIEHPSSRFDH